MSTEPDDDIEITTEADEPELEIEVKDPNPPAPEAEPEGATDEDLAGYSDKVKKRINRLTFEKAENARKLETEKRLREEAERLREEAITYATGIHTEAERLRKIVEQGEGVVINQAKQRVDAQLAKATEDYKRAYEAGDADQLAKATAEVSRLAAEQANLARTPQRKPGPEITPPPTQRPAASDKAAAWVARNPWFNTDPVMQGMALGVNKQLLAEGLDAESDVFYTRLDSAMKQRFPEKFDAAPTGEQPQRQTASVVAPASRTAGVTPRKVTLTPTEVALAKRLGITDKQYAAQKLKLRGLSNG